MIPQTFDHITIEGYRRLLSVSLDMRPLTVMIGANGAGKTSLLEVFSLLAASAAGRLEPKIAEAGGLSEITTRDRADRLRLSLRMPAERAPLEYTLEITPQAQGYVLSQELLSQQLGPSKDRPFHHIEARGRDVRYREPGKKGLLRPTWEHSPYETSLSQVPKMYVDSERFRSRLASSTLYSSLDVSPRSPVRLPQSMRPVELPGVQGEDLVSCLYYMRETRRERFERIEDTLSAAFPDFERLSFPPVAAGTLSMTWKDKSFREPIYMHQLSEGTLRFLWLTTLLQSGRLPAVTMIDEPDVSLHPELLQLLADLLREASQSTQLLVATHADRLVRSLSPDEVLVCDVEDGVATLTWGDSLDLEHWMKDFTLDELWAMHVVGGQP
jgi:predicted ATPase